MRNTFGYQLRMQVVPESWLTHFDPGQLSAVAPYITFSVAFLTVSELPPKVTPDVSFSSLRLKNWQTKLNWNTSKGVVRDGGSWSELKSIIIYSVFAFCMTRIVCLTYSTPILQYFYSTTYSTLEQHNCITKWHQARALKSILKLQEKNIEWYSMYTCAIVHTYLINKCLTLEKFLGFTCDSMNPTQAQHIFPQHISFYSYKNIAVHTHTI